jgi:hypothetical protein
MTTNPLTAIVRKGFDDICRDLSYAIADRGFSRTKTRLWVRYADDAIDVLSLYREGSSYGAPIGGNLDVRIQSYFRRPFDTTPHLILNGPQSDIARTRSGRYHLRFNAKSRHMYDRCLTDLVRFVNDECEPWFAEMKTSAPIDSKNCGRRSKSVGAITETARTRSHLRQLTEGTEQSDAPKSANGAFWQW